jgi:dihydroorotase
MSLAITGARVFTGQGLRDVDVMLDAGHVQQVGVIDTQGDFETIDGSGLVLGPGFVDLHVHFREPGQTWKEDIASGSASAVAGGFTAVVAMPNTQPAIDSGHVLDRVAGAARDVPAEVHFAGALTMGRAGADMAHLDDLYERGVRVFSDDGDCVADAGLLRAAMQYLSDRSGVVVAQHAEDVLIGNGGQLHDGEVARALGLRGIPPSAESTIIARDLILAAELDVHYHAQHISTTGSVELIRRAKDLGLRVSAEVTPHHLLLNESDAATLDTNFKMYPPLRSRDDRDQLIAALIEGTIDAVATDHAPHTVEEKDATFEKAPRGVIGLETAFSATYEALDRDLEVLFDRMSVRPAKIVGMAGHGQPIAQGSAANLVLIDPTATWTPDVFASRSSNSAFLGREMAGRVVATIRDGDVVFGGRDE